VSAVFQAGAPGVISVPVDRDSGAGMSYYPYSPAAPQDSEVGGMAPDRPTRPLSGVPTTPRGCNPLSLTQARIHRHRDHRSPTPAERFASSAVRPASAAAFTARKAARKYRAGFRVEPLSRFVPPR
jgi:hypothetical protein